MQSAVSFKIEIALVFPLFQHVHLFKCKCGSCSLLLSSCFSWRLSCIIVHMN